MSEGARRRVRPVTLAAARELRRPLTPAETLLWRVLRSRQLGGLKFRRQHPIGRYIADFCCLESHVVVELDGDSHEGREQHDDVRTQYLSGRGYRVLRFTNQQVYEDIEAITDAIAAACEQHRDR